MLEPSPALTTNPGCARRAVLDCAGVDKQRLAVYIDYPARFGQSQFTISRGNAFEARGKANGCAQHRGATAGSQPHTRTSPRRPRTPTRSGFDHP